MMHSLYLVTHWLLYMSVYHMGNSELCIAGLYDCNLIGLYKSESPTSLWYYNYVEAELISVMSVLFVYTVIITIIN